MRPVERATGEQLLTRLIDAQALLTSVSREIGPALDLQSTLAEIIAAMRRLVDFRGGSICLVDDGRVSIAAADPAVSPEVAAASIPLGQGLAGRIAATGEAIYSPDLDTDERVDPELRRLGSNAGMTSYLGVPLICLGRVIGLLQVDSPEVDAFDDVDRSLLEGLAAQTASAIESARQFEEHMRLEGLKRGFIQLVSHELRTPLTISSGMLGVVRSHHREMEASETDDLLDRSIRSLDRLQKLIEELLLMSQLMGEAIVPDLHPTPIAPILDKVRADSVDPDAVIVHSTDAVVRTDAALLTRVLSELVENALLYAGDCELDAEGSSVLVRDHGLGLPADIGAADFPTFRRSRSNETTVAGLGLGLTMAHALVAELGGQLTIEPAEGGGTCCRVELQPVDATDDTDEP